MRTRIRAAMVYAAAGTGREMERARGRVVLVRARHDTPLHKFAHAIHVYTDLS